MATSEEVDLFARLAAEPRLRRWVDAKLQAELKVLRSSSDMEVLMRAQGRAQMLDTIAELLDKAPEIARR